MSGQSRPIPLTIRFQSGLWRLRSADNRLSGVFTDLRSALRWATGETESHPGYALRLHRFSPSDNPKAVGQSGPASRQRHRG